MRQEWHKVAGKYKYLYEMDTKTAYNWLQVWVSAKHPSFEGCTINKSDNVRLQMNCVTDEIVQEPITMDDPHIMGVLAIVCVCVFLASGSEWGAVMHEIPISSAPS
jgi:hypothetical protein